MCTLQAVWSATQKSSVHMWRPVSDLKFVFLFHYVYVYSDIVSLYRCIYICVFLQREEAMEQTAYYICNPTTRSTLHLKPLYDHPYLWNPCKSFFHICIYIFWHWVNSVSIHVSHYLHFHCSLDLFLDFSVSLSQFSEPVITLRLSLLSHSPFSFLIIRRTLLSLNKAHFHFC